MRAPRAGHIDFGRRVWIVRTVLGARIDVRTVLVCAALLLLTAVVAVLAIGTGDYHVPPGQVLAAVFGHAPRITEIVVMQSRFPRVALAFLFGAALGVSGAIFQSLTRNPLGSPDIIGFSTGAYTGALVVILTLGGGYYRTGAGALVGGLVAAAVVYVLAYKRGVQGFRLIIVGIAVSAVLASVNTWLVVKADVSEAIAAAVWGAGTLNGLGWPQVVPVLVALAVVTPVAAALSTRLPVLEMGDDAARALGIRVEPTRLMLVILGVALTALVTAAAGPISFVALAAPQLARRLTGTSSVAMVPAACMGALLLIVSDVAAQRVFAPTQLPVGVVTVCVGGAYFVWLLAREGRKQ
ncbi:iron chelate uptake ABC transporter family permease subunit [Rhodococcus fascians]|nr:iron chelate uptake ABC transporter family permease subunit [Rhodococcus fascians]MBY4236046.1 iron chelate uptake ABC transporter family permease subunit [Rhodococcus fascians]MBY4251726.1 iron chelate uptake ABC transporter family permease subunit [Rhodococcus fascians]MBY4267392.1 iron chelate uptake ABC transporter family permease subunit [Rhodococcus fascians]